MLKFHFVQNKNARYNFIILSIFDILGWPYFAKALIFLANLLFKFAALFL